MSDFDKEAEREKLREKYEQEQESREVAEKMSELLLQGATMTNAHCSECGDPIFRYDGQEFCATCERAVDRDGEDADAGDGTADEGDNIEVTSPDDAQVKFGGDEGADPDQQSAQTPPADQAADPESPERRVPDREEAAADEESVEAGQPTPTEQPQMAPDAQRDASAADRRDPTVDGPADAARSGGSSAESGQQEPRSVPSVAPTTEGDVTAARESLVRTLTRFSQQAETAEDPQRAAEYLAAAREAADALSALRR